MLKRSIIEISMQWKIKPLQKKTPNRDIKSLITLFCVPLHAVQQFHNTLLQLELTILLAHVY